MPIDYKPLNERLLAVGAREDCVMCGHNDWTGLGRDQTQLAILPLANELDEWVPGEGLGTAGWVCRNCGFFRLHSLDVLGGEHN